MAGLTLNVKRSAQAALGLAILSFVIPSCPPETGQKFRHPDAVELTLLVVGCVTAPLATTLALAAVVTVMRRLYPERSEMGLSWLSLGVALLAGLYFFGFILFMLSLPHVH